MNKKNGFSLLELMVVIIVIGIIAVFAIPNYEYMRARQRERDAAGNLELLIEAVRLYASKTSSSVTGTPPALVDIDDINETLKTHLAAATNVDYECKLGVGTVAPAGSYFCGAFYRVDGSNWALAFNTSNQNDIQVYCFIGTYGGKTYGACPVCTAGGCPWAN